MFSVHINIIFYTLTSVSYKMQEAYKIWLMNDSVLKTLKGVLHLLPKISMFCALSQNNQQLFEK